MAAAWLGDDGGTAPLGETAKDLLGIDRGMCSGPECGCPGFARPTWPLGGAAGSSQANPLDAALLKCLRCGCPSRFHTPRQRRCVPAWPTYTEGAEALPNTQPPSVIAEPVAAPSSGSSSPQRQQVNRPSGSCSSPRRQPGKLPLPVGALVRFHGGASALRLGLVRASARGGVDGVGFASEEAPPGEALYWVAPLSDVGGEARGNPAEDDQDLLLPASALVAVAGSAWADAGTPAPCPDGDELVADLDGEPSLTGEVANFAEEAAFQRLVFQPAGVRPLADALRKRRCKLCALGGSISLQRVGYRAALVRALERRGVEVEDVPAAVGTAGSKPLALVVGDWVLPKKPDLLLIESAVNDGDELLEATPRPDVAGVLRAAEGIVRTVRRSSPGTVVVFLELFLREDAEAARVLKTGSEAWRESDSSEAIAWYHEVGPRLHRLVCARYNLAQINLIPAMRSLGRDDRRKWFRDDCHTTEFGGEQLGNLLARLLLWAVRQVGPGAGTAAAAPSTRNTSSVRPSHLPPALDRRCWCGGRTMRIVPGWLTPAPATRSERDPLKLGETANWLFLGAGGVATIPFRGRAFGILTLLGPDAPTLRVSVDGGPARELRLLDRWCFYWRDAVVLLCEGLADATHTIEVQVDPEPPDPGVLKRAPSSPPWDERVEEARRLGVPPQRLWLLYGCTVVGADSP